jgi:hypothetical protein
MSHPLVVVRLSYPGDEDPRHPVAIIQVNDPLQEYLISRIQEEGLYVEIEGGPTAILTVSAKTRTSRYDLSLRLKDIITAGHDEYCGIIGSIRMLLLQCTLPVIGNIRHTPPADSRRVRLGALKCSKELALFLEDYTEAAQLQSEIDSLAAHSQV